MRTSPIATAVAVALALLAGCGDGGSGTGAGTGSTAHVLFAGSLVNLMEKTVLAAKLRSEELGR